MKWIVLILIQFFIGNSVIFSEGHWDDVIPEKTEGQNYFVFGENVNVRKSTDTKSEVITKLQPGDNVTIVKKTNELLTQGKTKEFWYLIQFNDKQGYVWGSLLADGHTAVKGHTILVRNPGVNARKLEIKVIKENKIISKLNIADGPVSNENWEFKIYDSKPFTPSPGTLIGFKYLVFSEIEYGYSEETILSLTEDGKIANFYSWHPGGCDPPSCGDTWLLFPNDTLAEDKEIKRKKYVGEPNTVIEITRTYDVEDTSINEYSVYKRKWNGKTFMDKK